MGSGPQLVQGGARIPASSIRPLCCLLLRRPDDTRKRGGSSSRQKPSDARPSLWLLCCWAPDTPVQCQDLEAASCPEAGSPRPTWPFLIRLCGFRF